jgi:fatty acid desaturase
MLCRQCGTEIAEKAIVCYRCGAATTDPVRKAVPVRPRRSPVPSLVAAAILLLAAGWAGNAASTAADPEQWRMVAFILAGAAAIVVVLGLIRGRR